MEDLIPWLRAELDAESRDAQLASDSAENWTMTDTGDSGPTVGEWSREINYQMWHCDDEQDGCPEISRGWVSEARHIARHSPARVLAEVDAKRRILEIAEVTRDHERDNAEAEAAWWLISGVVSALALPYADRPGYRAEWRP